jgi:hypothetical protein
MTLAIFAFGLLVFLITVYGTVVAGGLLLTGRQLEEQPELLPDESRTENPDVGLERARSLARSEY